MTDQRGDTQEGAVPPEAAGNATPVDGGNAAGSTTEQSTETTPKDTSTDTPKEKAAPAAPEGTTDQGQDNWQERYQNLEKKLGDWKQTESDAEAFRKLQQAIQTPEEPEKLPDFSRMTPEEQISWLDERTEQRATKIASKLLEEKLNPLAEDVYADKAKQAIQLMREAHPDFDEYKAEIGKFLDDNPALAENMNKDVLEMAYRFVRYDKAAQEGAEQAVNKLKKKQATTAPQTSGATKTERQAPASFKDAWDAAEEELG